MAECDGGPGSAGLHARDENNQDVTLSGLRGKPVVLVFYPLDFSPICTTEVRLSVTIFPASSRGRARRSSASAATAPGRTRRSRRRKALSSRCSLT